MGLENGFNSEHNCEKEPTSGLAFIDYNGNDPFELFKEWLEEAKEYTVNPNAMCFTTCSKDGIPSSRHLLLRRLDEDGFVIMTDNRSRKTKELTENPHCCMAFLWSFRKEGKTFNKQVRIDGVIEELCQSSCQEIWDREPLFCKIRANICTQGVPTEWDELKRNHDNLYQDVTTNKQIPEMPSHVVFYKVIPHFMDFYFAYDNFIGDRLAFHKVNKNATAWKAGRIAA